MHDSLIVHITVIFTPLLLSTIPLFYFRISNFQYYHYCYCYHSTIITATAAIPAAVAAAVAVAADTITTNGTTTMATINSSFIDILYNISMTINITVSSLFFASHMEPSIYACNSAKKSACVRVI